jgi:protein O-mannosyl-transferase
LIIVAILAVTLFAFTPCMRNSFINWDDNWSVLHNPHLAKPLSKVISHYLGPNYTIGNYMPLTMLSFAVQYKANGADASFFHKVSIVIHLLNVLLVFRLAFLLSGRSTFVAAVVSLFFGVHPMHVESVAWVAEQKDLLYTFFFVSALLVYLKYVSTAGRRWTLYLAFSLLFVLSLLSKPAVVVFPLVLLLVDWYLLRRIDSKAIIEKIPLVVLSLVFGLVTIHAQKEAGLLHETYNAGQKILFASYSLVVYVFKLILPLQLAIFHPYPNVNVERLPSVFYFAPVVVALFVFVVYRLRKHRGVMFGSLFFLLNIILVLQLVSAGDAMMAERYTYVSYLGLFFIVASVADKYTLRMPRLQRVATVVFVILGGVCAFATHQRCKVWRSDSTIADDLLKKYPDDWLTLNNMGFVLYSQQRTSEAIVFYRRSLAVKPDYARAAINLTEALLVNGNPLAAAAVADSALAHKPGNFYLLRLRGIASSQLGDHLNALRYYRHAIALDRYRSELWNRVAESHYLLKDIRSTKAALDSALALDPRNYLALNSKGYMLYLEGKFEEAIGYFRRSLGAQPDYGVASVNLRNAMLAMQDSTAAKK